MAEQFLDAAHNLADLFLLFKDTRREFGGREVGDVGFGAGVFAVEEEQVGGNTGVGPEHPVGQADDGVQVEFLF